MLRGDQLPPRRTGTVLGKLSTQLGQEREPKTFELNAGLIGCLDLTVTI